MKTKLFTENWGSKNIISIIFLIFYFSFTLIPLLILNFYYSDLFDEIKGFSFIFINFGVIAPLLFMNSHRPVFKVISRIIIMAIVIITLMGAIYYGYSIGELQEYLKI